MNIKKNNETAQVAMIVLNDHEYQVPREVADYVKERQRMHRHAMKMALHGSGCAFAELPPKRAIVHALRIASEHSRHAVGLLRAITVFVKEMEDDTDEDIEKDKLDQERSGGLQ